MARRRSARPSFVPTVVPLSAAVFVLGTAATLIVLSLAGVELAVPLVLGVARGRGA